MKIHQAIHRATMCSTAAPLLAGKLHDTVAPDARKPGGFTPALTQAKRPAS